jgi:hypothetical protein
VKTRADNDEEVHVSVLMTMVFKGDAAGLEEYAANNEGAMRGIVDHAVEHGLIAHRFYGSDSGQLMVVDEWPDAESFQSFFAHMADQIGPIMDAAGVTEEPNPVFWRELDARDAYGWNA